MSLKQSDHVRLRHGKEKEGRPYLQHVLRSVLDLVLDSKVLEDRLELFITPEDIRYPSS